LCGADYCNEKEKKIQYQSRLSTLSCLYQLLFIVPGVLDWELEPLHRAVTGPKNVARHDFATGEAAAPREPARSAAQEPAPRPAETRDLGFNENADASVSAF
jgi:hypothetical protein